MYLERLVCTEGLAAWGLAQVCVFAGTGFPSKGAGARGGQMAILKMILPAAWRPNREEGNKLWGPADHFTTLGKTEGAGTGEWKEREHSSLLCLLNLRGW